MLLSHIPLDHPGAGSLATGVTENLEQPELRAWLEGRTTLDHAARVGWAKEQVIRLEIRSTFFEDQAGGARADLGELALREADAMPAQLLHQRVRSSEHEMSQADLGLAFTERRLERLLGADR